MKKKLLIVTDVMAIGGVEKVIVNTLNGLDYSKFDVTLFIMYKTEGEKNNVNKIPEKVRIRYLFHKSVKGIYQRILYYLFMFFPSTLMNKLIVKENYDIVVTTKDIFTYPIRVNKCHKVMWIHGGLEHLETEKSTIFIKFKRWIQKRTYSKFDKIIMLTNGARKRFGNKYDLKERCYVLFNPINTNEITKLSNEAVFDYDFKNNINIVCSCRLSVEKGVDRLIHSCKRLLSEGYDFNLIILGDGPEKVELNKMILKTPMLSEKIAILGFKDNPYKYMNRCSLYVSSSLTEGFPLSVAEAIILELPILSTYCNGPAEMVDNGKYGLLVENSENGIYEGLKNMLSDPELMEYYKMKSKERREFFIYEENIRLFEKFISGQ
ncbi:MULTISPECIES: glycosyltransferase [Bacillus cereus group]|uniref:glycosyltransferase n=1 Tax=Bacillus cereus group TaxID=86661 RepID=UPI001C02C89C|nr:MULTISPECIES: glycosyltransferase [Bacillus cereus group]MDM5463593.1 glycosyltransferase [Bacillus cereus]QWH38586.1 glycosyltransferase [Bacillus mycoides]QWI50654.1 glycosyltransferase [Bacillus mycoides]